MKGRIWFSALMAIVGASLLVAASASGGTTASSAASQSTAQKGGTFRILNTSDFDHLDPAQGEELSKLGLEDERHRGAIAKALGDAGC